MITNLLTRIVGSSNDRTLKKLRKIVKQINAMEPTFESLSDADLKAKTVEFRTRLEKGETLEQLLPEAFATVREASKRVFGMRHFDVQLLGGVALHNGNIAEMRTGEGKTLVSTCPAYLNALAGKGVHENLIRSCEIYREIYFSQFPEERALYDSSKTAVSGNAAEVTLA